MVYISLTGTKSQGLYLFVCAGLLYQAAYARILAETDLCLWGNRTQRIPDSN